MSFRLHIAALAALACASCGDPAEFAPSGKGEPFQADYVREGTPDHGQFFPGDIPMSTQGPIAYSLQAGTTRVRAGLSGWGFGGDAQKGSYSVAIRFRDLGTGYWIVPVGAVDPVTSGDLAFGARLNFSRDVPPGMHDLVVVPVTGDGSFGQITAQSILTLNVLSRIPDADIVLTLEWDTDADLDLHLVGPLAADGTGHELDPQHPATAAADPNTGAFPPGTGFLDHDSNDHCVVDGYRQEDVVWNSHTNASQAAGLPASGAYLVRVDMFDSCGAAYANFKITLYVHGAEYFTRTGRLLGIDADGGGPGSGLFVAQLAF